MAVDGHQTPRRCPIRRRTPPRRRARRAPSARSLSKESELAGAVKALVARRRARRGARAVRRAGRPPAAARRPHRLPLPARRARRRRSGPGRVPEGVHAHHQLSRRPAVRGVVHPHPRQRLPRPPQGAGAAAAVGAADVAARPTRRRPSRSAPQHQRRGAADLGAAHGRRSATAVGPAAGPAARGVHAVPHRRADDQRGQPGAGTQRGDGARAPVPRRPQAARRCWRGRGGDLA